MDLDKMVADLNSLRNLVSEIKTQRRVLLDKAEDEELNPCEQAKFVLLEKLWRYVEND